VLWRSMCLGVPAIKASGLSSSDAVTTQVTQV
jgi:hypothetical protein